MTNVIYNFFLQKYFSHDVDLENGSYRLALFKGTYTPSVNGTTTYNALSLAGFECEDDDPNVSDNPNKGYKKGGVPVKFTKIENPEDVNDVYRKYSCGDVVFNDYLSLSGENTAYYAIIYRKSDGLLVSCFPFDVPITLDKEGLTLSWSSVVTIQISADLGIKVDGSINPDSGNPVQNKAIAEAFERYNKSLEKYGIRLEGEEDDNPDTDENNMDTLCRVSESSIDRMAANIWSN